MLVLSLMGKTMMISFGIADLNEEDRNTLNHLVTEFSHHSNCSAEEILKDKFTKLYPKYLRPYGQLYTY
jgi:glutamate synthase domain-containing protein 3